MLTSPQVVRMRSQLQEFVESFAAELGRSERRHWCGKYLEGLLVEGERKSIEPMAARVNGGDEQAMQQFVNQSPWDYEAVMSRLREQLFAGRGRASGVLVLDDTSLPKKGCHSVGVARQYCGALGKVANCQSVVSWLWAGEHVHWPVAAELYLPEAWTSDPQRMTQAGVPEHARHFREKWRVALDLLAQCKPQLPAYQAIVFDAGYGAILPLLEALEAQGEPYVAQIPAKIATWPADVAVQLQRKATGRPQKHWRVRDRSLRPLRAEQWRDELLANPGRWKTVRLPRADGSKVRAVAVRVRATERQAFNYRPGVERWLLIEQLSDNTYKYYLSNLPAETLLAELVRLAHQRWKVEQGYQQLKEELGLDHFEGRSWRGLHHHLTLCFLAYAFLNRVRVHAPKKIADAA